MKVLIVHNQYRQRGGEDTVFEAETRLLASAGTSVSTYVVNNDTIQGFGAQLRTSLETTYSRRAYKALTAKIVDERPDIVHVHNFFPLLTPSIFDACRNAGVPVVVTLHNFRVTCANAMLLRGSQPCTLCINGSPYWSVAYRCYRNSFFGSFAVANMIAFHRWRHTWHRSVNRFIALSAFARNRFIDAGLPAERIKVKPNFVFDPFPDNEIVGQREGALFVGRLSHEKGINILLDAWRQAKIPLTIIGDGPAVEAVRAAQSPRLNYLGPLPSEHIFSAMRRSRFLLLPSIWYEGFPRVVVEAFASGLPIIASRIGSLEELIDDNYNGYHFNPGDSNDLLRVISQAFAPSERADLLSRGARETYERCFTPERNLRQLNEIYRETIGDAQSQAASAKSRTKPKI